LNKIKPPKITIAAVNKIKNVFVSSVIKGRLHPHYALYPITRIERSMLGRREQIHQTIEGDDFSIGGDREVEVQKSQPVSPVLPPPITGREFCCVVR
jgi:hypothetical protein